VPGHDFLKTRPLSKGAGRRLLTLFSTLTLFAAACIATSPARGGASETPPLSVWNPATAPSPEGAWYSVDYVNGRWIALGHTAEVAVSTNASTWTEYPIPAGSWQSVVYGDGEYVALSSTVGNPEEIISTNGTDWTAVSGPAGEWDGLVYGQGRFVAVGPLGQIITSTNGLQWTQVWHHSKWSLTSVAYGNGHFVAVDAAVGSTLISANGVNWSLYPPLGTGLKWSSVVYGNGTFVAFDESGAGYVATSVYGYVWALHRYSPAEEISGATFGCGDFVAAGQSSGSANNILSSSIGASWSAVPVPTDTTADWTAVAYGAHKYVAVDDLGSIAWTNSATNCAATVPSAPLQVSGNVAAGQVWTYMHPSTHSGGSPISNYRVTVSDGAMTKECPAAVYFQPNCIIKGLVDHHVYWVTAQAHNRFGYSAYTDPEFVIPVAKWSLSAVTTDPVISASGTVVVQVTGVIANSQGEYPTSVVTVHFGSKLAYCHPNPFGECLITINNPAVGPTSIYASYTGYGRSYTSPVSLVTITS
jgi:hypothetical protein